MKFKNIIASGLCMALAMVSFLHPFSGKTVYAETAAATCATAEAETEAAVEAHKETETETESETHTHTTDETEEVCVVEEAEAEEETHAAKEEETVAESACEERKAERTTEEVRASEEAETAEEETRTSEGAKTEAEKVREETETATEKTEQTGAEVQDVINTEKDDQMLHTVQAMRTLAQGESNYGIDENNPRRGQKNCYEYLGSAETWTCPATGIYDIYCYGAAGTTGIAGAMRASRAEITGGTILKITVGGKPSAYSWGGSLGEGHTKSHTSCKYTTLETTADGTVIGQDMDIYQYPKNGKFHYWGMGSGRRYRGYPDGGWGDFSASPCDNGNHTNQASVGYGGGGSSFVSVNDIKVISGMGGSGGGASNERICGSNKGGTAKTGAGGGVTCLNDTAGLTWLTSELDETAKASDANGSITIEIVKVNPDVKMEQDIKNWTNQTVTITATPTSKGEGLPDHCLSWETDEDGNDIWTDETSYTVSQNGTYTCKIRDVEGNIGETSIEITNIDRLHPEGELTADITDWTREDVTLTITADDAEATEEYARSGLAEPPYLWGYRDEKGNVIWESKETGDTGEAAPTDPAESENTAGQAGASGEQAAATENLTAQAETGQEEAEETPETEENWTDEITHVASQNGTYLCRVRDKAGNESTYEYTVSNIDRTAPEVDYKHPDKWYEGGTTLTWKATDLQPDGSAGCGLHEMAYSYNGTDWTTNTIQEIQAAGTYRIWVRDKLENVAECTFWVGYDKRPSGKKGEELPDPALEPETETEIEELLKALEDSMASSGKEGTKQGIDLKLRREDEKNMKNTDDLFAPVFMASEEIPEALPLFEAEGDGELSDAAMQSLLLGAEDEQGRQIPWKKIVLYSAWMVTVLCGLLWILFCLLFEHVEVYQKNRQGRYDKIGRCALIRKREYTQVNLLGFMKRQDGRDYMLRFSHLYVRFHKRDKVLIRTISGVELRNVARKIEILCAE